VSDVGEPPSTEIETVEGPDEALAPPAGGSGSVMASETPLEAWIAWPVERPVTVGAGGGVRSMSTVQQKLFPRLPEKLLPWTQTWSLPSGSCDEL
jgi:hypothetical protein